MAEGIPGQKNGAPKQELDWAYEKRDGRWEMVQVPKLGYFSNESIKERERRDRNTHQMVMDTAEQWKLNDPTVLHNEGILRDHPRYQELFIKWAKRYLEMRGFDFSPYSGQIESGEGNLLLPGGRFSKVWLPNAVANNREWVDENIEMELRAEEGFVDITNDEERQKALGIQPKNEGWWTQNEI